MILIKVKDHDGVEHEFEAQEGKSIIDIAEEQGIFLPFACRAGACTVCSCGVKSGREFLEQNLTGQKIIDLDDTKFLACIGGAKKKYIQDGENHIIELDFSA